MADPENVVDNTGDIVITDKELFDQAIAPDPAPAERAVPPPAPSAEPAPQQQPQQPDIPRDQQGRFAPKPPQQAATTQQDGRQQPPQQQRMPEDHRVPLRELLDERERRQRIEARAAQIEAEAYQMRQAWAQFQAQQQAAAQQQQAPQTIFDDPDGYLSARVMNPLRQEGQMEIMKVKDEMSRDRANERFGEQTVNAALQAISQVRHTPQGDLVFRQIMASGHPYGALVNWHNTARVHAAIGPDPNAWLKQKQQEWVRDPNAQAAVLQYLRQQQQPAGRPPNVSLPPSLNSMPSSSGRLDDQGDLSNESLYRFATR